METNSIVARPSQPDKKEWMPARESLPSSFAWRKHSSGMHVSQRKMKNAPVARGSIQTRKYRRLQATEIPPKFNGSSC
jgi:hypothetical protein